MAQVLMKHARTPVERADFAVPTPPTDNEKYWYMGRQHRWLLLAQAASFILIAYSIARFATADTRLLLFLVPMSLYMITLCISLLSSARKKRTSLADHLARVRSYTPEHYPSVDVFLPTAGEPLDVLQNTYSYIQHLEWAGRLRVYVLDDAARPEVQGAAEEAGFTYLSRPDRGRLKKAGNLRFGYEHSDGDFIAIFDADFAPRADYLQELMPYFDDAEVGIVQSPQFFDARKGMAWLQRCAGATQELFYRWIEPARDRARAAICVGTCAVYRRAGLQKSGGFAQIGHSEDVHTGVNLMKVGYYVRYVPILVAKGLCPDTLAGFLTQQYRWCTGSMSLLADKSFHAAQHIRLPQRLCFWAGFLYYISTGVNAFVAPLPALAMLFFLPQWVEPMNSIWLLGALTLWFIVLPRIMKGGWRVDVLRVQLLYSFAHAVAIFHIATGRTQEWVATGAANKRTTPLATTIARVAKTYIVITQLLIYVGLAVGTYRYGFDKYWAMIALAVLAAYVHWPVVGLSAAKRHAAPSASSPRSLRALLRRFQSLVITVAAGQRAKGLAAWRRAPGASPAGTATAHREGIPAASRRFRADIQGLRTVAVLLVVLYHAGVPGITGGYVGVDVFFVISGFLITGLLVREAQKTGRISLSRFYARRIRRLLPPAAIVLLATLVAHRIWGSLFQLGSVAWDAIATSLYAVNYRFAAEGINYQQASGPESPFQHFWSLAVEEQFYIVWPALIMLVLWTAKRHVGKVLLPTLLLVTATSFYLSVTVTQSNAPLAYFSLQTRAWELGIGALVALTAASLQQLPRLLQVTASWAGLAAIMTSAVVYSADTPYPGSFALLPVGGAAALIATGGRLLPLSANTLLGRRPLVSVGTVSYGWYLWHWPVLVLVPAIVGRNLTWWENLELVGVALWLAVITYWLVESPTARILLRRRVWYSTGVVLSGSVAALATLLIVTAPGLIGGGKPAQVLTLSSSNTAVVKNAVANGTSIVRAPRNLDPALRVAAKDQPVSTSDGCHANFLIVEQGSCVYGDAAGSRTMVLVGDSHAQQWLPALDQEASAKGWRLITWTKAACPIAQYDIYNPQLHRDFTECSEWRQRTIQRIIQLHPDLVVMSQSDAVPGTAVANNEWAERTVRSAREFQNAGLRVTYILDTPYPGKNIPDCVASNLDSVGDCSARVERVWPYGGRHDVMAQTLTLAGITSLEPRDWFCTIRDCPAIIGNILVYRDDSHMSTAYSAWLAPMMGPLFAETATSSSN